MAFLSELATNASAKNVSMIFYSGNDDSLVPHRGTEGSCHFFIITHQLCLFLIFCAVVIQVTNLIKRLTTIRPFNMNLLRT